MKSEVRKRRRELSLDQIYEGIAEALYDEYNRVLPQIPAPAWNGLPEAEHNAWVAVAKEALATIAARVLRIPVNLNKCRYNCGSKTANTTAL
jgi:hypothetical protein